ncbi:MAG: hypothetical protein KBT12_00420 [Bacteroidales bacterium]|nr:hypothetical protein [Candidatus Physcousia equi]
MKRIYSVLFLFALFATHALAYVTIDLAAQVSTTSQADHIQTTIDGLSLNYIKNINSSSPAGASLYYATWTDMYKLNISSANGKNIIAVELDGQASSSANRGTLMVEELGNGNLDHHANSTSYWTGTSKTLRFACGANSTYAIQRIRVWFEGEAYVPTEPTEGGEEQEEVLMGKPMVRPASTPQNGKAVKMAIVSVRKFETQVKKYALWKTKQGYDVEEVYVEDNDENGTLKENALAINLQKRLKELHPTYVLIMGDHEQVPSFLGTLNYKQTSGSRTTYVTDYFYGEYTDDYAVPYEGDYQPEAYVGRFSGWEAEDIEAQMNKTEYMARLSGVDASWLDNSLCILSDDPKDPTIKRGHDYVVNYLEKKVESHVKNTGLINSTINSTINEGCSFVSYYGHGGIGDLNASYRLQDALQLTNQGKYPIFMAMTCLTGTFDNDYRTVMCLAEQMQRMPNAGTLAYVGATRESYLDMQFMTGGTNSNDGQSYLGFMRSMFPTTDEDPLNQQARTIGEGFTIARYGIRYAGWTFRVKETQEYHALFGDPTYMPYSKAPQTMTVTKPEQAMAGCAFTVLAAPHAVVCISKNRSIVAVALADAEGKANLTADINAAPGSYTFYCSAPNFKDYESTITLQAFDEQGVTPSTFDFNTYARKRVLIEKFTGQNCGYCTTAENTTKNYVETNQDKLYEIRHYSYDGDRIAASFLKLDFHGDLFRAWEFSGHPTYMVDRAGYQGQSSVTSDGYKVTPEEIVNRDRVNDRWNRPCQVSLSLDGSTYDPTTRLLRVVVSGKMQTNLPDPCINIFLTQNKMNAYQSSWGLIDHNGVSRAFLTNKVTGDALTPNEDGTFQVVYYYTVPTTIGSYATVLENMDVVAFVSSWDNYAYNKNKDGKDYFNSQVYNTEVLRLAEAPLRAMMPVLPNGSIDMASGDVNGDGKTNVNDLTQVIASLNGKAPQTFNLQAADLDHDGKVTKKDKQLLVERILAPATR